MSEPENIDDELLSAYLDNELAPMSVRASMSDWPPILPHGNFSSSCGPSHMP